MKKAFTLIELLVVVAFIWLLVIIVGTLASSPSGVSSETTYPAPTGYVVDQAEVLDEATETSLAERLKAFDPRAQIAVATVKTTSPLDIEGYSIKLAEKWGVGDKAKDNGIIFLIATEDRKMRVEVGQGLEGDITDSEAGRIIDEVRPFFKDGDWNGGTKKAVDLIIKEIQ
jgi:uncharacterized protein